MMIVENTVAKSLDTEDRLFLDTQMIANECTAILGTRGMGKSNTVALLLEQNLPEMPYVVIDLHGEYRGLRTHFNIPIFGRSPFVDLEVGPDAMETLADYSFENRQSLILDLRDVGDENERIDFVHRFLNRLWDRALKAEVPRPYGIVLEEAHNFIPEGKVQNPALKKIKTIVLEGRKFGLSVIIASQRAAEVSKTVLGQCGLVFLHGAYLYHDFQQYQHMLPMTINETKSATLELETGQAIVRYRKSVGTYQMRKRKTLHVGDTPTLDEIGKLSIESIDQNFLEQMRSLIDSTSKDIQSNDCSTLKTQIQELQANYDSLCREFDQERLKWIGAIAEKDEVIDSLRKQIEGTPVPLGISLTKPIQQEDCKSPLQTTRGINRQERAFAGLIADIQTAGKFQQRILKWLFEREGQQFNLKEIARYLGLSYNTVYHHMPMIFVERNIMGRSGRGQKAQYWSRLSKYLQDEFPDLDQEKITERLLKALPEL